MGLLLILGGACLLAGTFTGELPRKEGGLWLGYGLLGQGYPAAATPLPLPLRAGFS